MQLTIQQLQAVTGCSAQNAAKYLGAFNETLTRYAINTPLRVAHFAAQASHESANLSVMSENLNYNAAGLRKIFGKYFPTVQSAQAYARKPQSIASRVYAGRYGNGNEVSGDGWKFRGRGMFQMTFKDNYQLCSNEFGIDFTLQPDLLAEVPYCILTAGFYWASRSLNKLADANDIVAITRRINGGTHGLDDRKKRFAKARKALGL